LTGLPYIPSKTTNRPLPLSRFLPPPHEGVASTWLKHHFPDSDRKEKNRMVLVPFGADPYLVVEIARAGYQVVVTENNPILRFMIEMIANPPSIDECKNAIADLSASFRGDDRLEPLIRSFYSTHCVKCGFELQVDAFLWDRGATSPYAKLYTCQNCGDSGEKLVQPFDVELSTQFLSSGLHRARALERVTSLNDSDRHFAEEALDAYLPRAIYILFTLINKLDSLQEHKRILSALFLTVFDQATSLWSYPTQRSRPRIISIPTHFKENNIWTALENSIEQWATVETVEHIPVSTWPVLPPEEGGVCLFEGRVKDFLLEFASDPSHDDQQLNQGTDFIAVISALPRPNQAFWTLSVLWAGWLWGKNEASHFKSILRRRRFDWSWHSTALHSAFSAIRAIISVPVPILTLVSEIETGFMISATLAGLAAGYDLKSIALREETENAQLQWIIPVSTDLPIDKKEDSSNAHMISRIREENQKMIIERGEPVSYLHMVSYAFTGKSLIKSELADSVRTPAETYPIISSIISQAFQTDPQLVHIGGSEHSLESGKWWLETGVQSSQDHENYQNLKPLSLADRVEMCIVKYLIERPDPSYFEIDYHVCTNYPGLLTPERSIIQACIHSYAVEENPGSDDWSLRDEDHPANRRENLHEMFSLAENLGNRIGYQVKKAEPDPNFFLPPIHWVDNQQNLRYVFYFQASALVSKTLIIDVYPPDKCILVFPGSRSGLLDQKISNDFRLVNAIQEGWRFLKFRHLRYLANNEAITKENFESLLAMDTITQTDAQIPML